MEDGDEKQLRERVDALEIAAGEREKPWYKQPSNLVSIAAVIVAIAAIFQTQSNTHSENQSQVLNDLQQISMQLVENTQAISESINNAATSPSTASVTQSLLNTKANMLLSRGVELIGEYKGQVPPEVPFILGTQAWTSGRYLDAVKLLTVAVHDKGMSSARVDAERALASLYMSPNTPVEDIAKGEQIFTNTVSLLKQERDPYSIGDCGYVYEGWAQAEFALGHTAAGFDKFADAEKTYDLLPSTMARFGALQRIVQERAAGFAITPVGRQVISQLAGNWLIHPSGIDGASQVGTLTFTVDSNTGILGVSLQRSPGGVASQVQTGPSIRASGIVLIEDPHTASFDWRGTALSLGSFPVPVSGSIKLTFSGDLTSAVAEEQQPNLPLIRYKLVKQVVHQAPQ